MNLQQIVAANIKAAREASGMSQEQVADALGLASHSAVSELEAGTRKRISLAKLQKLAELFGKTIDWFFDPKATSEDFVTLARAQTSGEEVKRALRDAERLVLNYLFLKKVLGNPKHSKPANP